LTKFTESTDEPALESPGFEKVLYIDYHLCVFANFARKTLFRADSLIN